MNFLKNLFARLFKRAPKKKAPSTQQPDPNKPGVSASKEVSAAVQGAGSKKKFLEELRSIEPASKEFDTAKHELIDELKKLDPHQKNPQ